MIIIQKKGQLNSIAQEDWYNEKTARYTKDQAILSKILRKGNDDLVSVYAAENQNCPSGVLAEILKRGKDDLVSRTAAMNLNCPSEVLAEVLRRGKNDWVSGDAAKNPNCPPEALAEVLRRGEDDRVSRYAISNPNISSEVLAEVLRRGKNDVVSWRAARSFNCPSEALAEVLIKGKIDRVSRFAIQNPNCPPKAKLEWYEATGQLTKYDPERFELEHVEEDKDLEDLRKLISKNKKGFVFPLKNNKEKEDIMKTSFNLNKFRKQAFYDDARGEMVTKTRCMQNCYKQKTDKGKSPQEAWQECFDEYNKGERGKWSLEYSGSKDDTKKPRPDGQTPDAK